MNESFYDEVMRRLAALEEAVHQLTLKANKGVRGSRPANYEEVEAYVIGVLKLTANDAAALWEHWEGNGFKNHGKAMASWKATASNWERRELFFPTVLQRKWGKKN